MKSLKTLLHHLFVPHEGNNYRAKVLHLDFLSYYLIFALFLTFGFKIINTHSGDVLGYATDISVEKLYQLTNEVRKQHQLQTLTFNDQLATAAKKKATDMFAKNYWSHYGPDGATPWDFILDSGYRYEFAGENLAKNFLFSQGVLDAWMASPSHRDNILRKDYTEVGFAIVNGVLNGEETTLVVEMFGKPLYSTSLQQTTPSDQSNIRPLIAEAETQVLSEEPGSISHPEAIIPAQKSPNTNKIRQFSLNTSLIFISFLLVVFIMDIYFARKFKVIRITGKNLAHLIFIGFIFIGLFILTKGSIL